MLSRYASAVSLALLKCASLLAGWLTMRVAKLMVFLLVLQLLGLGSMPVVSALLKFVAAVGGLALALDLVHRRLAGAEHHDDAWLD